ncbi:hypothetical protein [Halobacterium sp. KA-6]|jgi:hypothetical protein|uniref:hypothetical protein n=1 Tax=Halobacterium sp. KA-6 TaxID=2896368 RepID=UPI001E34002E|nr:hypothetical protein [Halobacterium sp. KA-6]MCD2204820.1 hypothetical protein [Halobacterium sp. KA-6]
MTEQTLADVSQRNPEAPEGVGSVFRRGPVVAADGGKREATEEQTMKDVDQTPPAEDEGANPVWERGGEPVADEDGRDE